MVTIIVYGLVIGVILSILPSTRKLGVLVLMIVGALFLITSAFLILGELFMSALPIIIFGLIILGIYGLVKKGKGKREGNAAFKMSDEERKAREATLKDLL